MSTDTQESVAEEATRKRTVLSLLERIKVIDYLRSLPEPIVADSNNEIAAKVSEAAGVTINWQQLKYMLDELAGMNLGAKVYVKSPLSVEDQLQAALDRAIALETRVAELEKQMVQTVAAMLELTKRVTNVNPLL